MPELLNQNLRIVKLQIVLEKPYTFGNYIMSLWKKCGELIKNC